MSERCSVCGADVAATSSRCERCGFPTALAAAVPPPSGARHPAEPAPARATAGEAPAATPSTAHRSAVTSAAAKDLLGRAGRLRDLGVDTKPLEMALRDAALREAWGETDAAVAEMRQAGERLTAAEGEAIGARRARLAARRARLVDAGLEIPPDPSLDTVAGLLERGEVAQALETLRASEKAVEQTALAWQELEEAFAEVAGVRDLAGRLGIPLSQTPDRVAPVRSRLGAGNVKTAQIAPALAEARRELGELSTALSGPARTMLDDLRERSGASPFDPLEVSRLRTIADRAAHQLAEGHVAEALRALLELRDGTPPLAAPAARPKGAAEPRAAEPARAPPPSSEGSKHPSVSAESLLAKARSFANKVRALPPDSPAAREAAAQIREATDLLRQGRLAEADAALTRLMRTFAGPEGRSEP